MQRVRPEAEAAASGAPDPMEQMLRLTGQGSRRS